MLKCSICHEHLPLRSNRAVRDEYDRQSRYLQAPAPVGPSCREPTCKNFGIPVPESEGAYIRFGQTTAGSQRYRCKACGCTFADEPTSVTARQRKPHKNRDIFMLIVNQVAITRILETADIGVDTFYRKLRFIHEQCQAFAGHRERRLWEGRIQLPVMSLSIDRQHYIVNWAKRTDRRTVQLNAIGTADIRTGYVFGMTLNYDSSTIGTDVEADAAAVGDNLLPGAFRKWARVWLQEDYREAIAESVKRKKARDDAREKAGATVRDKMDLDVGLEYIDALSRDDIERSDMKDASIGLPKFGVQVHEQYVMQGHFMLLEKLVRTAPAVRLYMDQDSGFRAAALTAFGQRIKARVADVFYVKVEKAATAYEKKAAVAEAQRALEEFMSSSGISDRDRALIELMKLEIAASSKFTRWSDRWARHPAPIASEPDKRICWLTDMGGHTPDEQARLMLKATLHPIDKFFMQTRRRVRLAERPLQAARREGIRWNGYGAYNPEVLQRCLEIYRTYYNFCLRGKDKKTPAMRLGLAKTAIDPHTILHYR
mgnify:CR=1 FL=1|jgi:transposase-like protein